MTEWNNETAEWYAEKYGEYPTNHAALEGLDLSPELVVVDVGCGTGSALRFASEKVTKGKLIGIDPVDRMVEIARDKTSNHSAVDRISFQTGPAESLPLEDNLSDLVLAFDSIDHWQDQAKGLGEIQRILKRTGKFVLVKDLGVPDASNKLIELRSLLGKSGFEIIDDQELTFEEISFVRIICKDINTYPDR